MMLTAITEPSGRSRRSRRRRALEILRTPGELSRFCDRCRAAGLSIGLVPTMGALHAGHRSLIDRARAETDRVVVSVFVNPTQFGPGEDFARYPRALEDDLSLCRSAGADVVYAPTTDEVYPDGFATMVRVSGAVGQSLEGAHRQGHFDGVATIVAKLLIASHPDRAYFGHKDAQQCAVVRRMASDLDTGTSIVTCPTVRDADGLAISSRNAYLDPGQRKQALAIPAALAAAHLAHAAGELNSARLCALVKEELSQSSELVLDYVAIVDATTFEPIDELCVRCEILIAARIGGTRLIDVLTPGVDDPPEVTVDQGPPLESDSGRSEACSASS